MFFFVSQCAAGLVAVAGVGAERGARYCCIHISMVNMCCPFIPDVCTSDDDTLRDGRAVCHDHWSACASRFRRCCLCGVYLFLLRNTLICSLLWWFRLCLHRRILRHGGAWLCSWCVSLPADFLCFFTCVVQAESASRDISLRESVAPFP